MSLVCTWPLLSVKLLGQRGPSKWKLKSVTSFLWGFCTESFSLRPGHLHYLTNPGPVSRVKEARHEEQVYFLLLIKSHVTSAVSFWGVFVLFCFVLLHVFFCNSVEAIK